MNPRILIVDDESNYLVILRELLSRDGFAVDALSEPLEALKLAAKRPFDVALVDLRMGDLDGVEVMERLHRLDADLGVVIMTAFATVETAVDSLKRGAADYVLKPFDNQDLLRILRRAANLTRLSRENARLREAASAGDDVPDLIGASKQMEAVRRLVAQVARTETTVLITGETGTGKEVVARAIHRASARADQPFIAVHCAALAESLLESELFGHERGAFTGAVSTKRGRFELAQGGTLFLDEVGEIPEHVQVKLLRAIESRSFERVGGEASLETDARFIAATNRDLESAIKSGRFREDLYYRLNVLRIEIPPLRDRPEDVARLAQHFLRRCAARMQRPGVRLDERASELLGAYRWPGNVRELENIVERALVITPGDLIGADALPPELKAKRETPPALEAFAGKPLQSALEEVERALLLQALEDCGYVQARAAERLGLSKSALHYKLTKYGIHGRSKA
ncbi:MAG: sigma-54 dependent transcriptional regulator [Myxococcota bacterium]